MATEEIREPIEDRQAIPGTDPKEMTGAKKEVPIPRGVSDEEARALAARAQEVARQLEEASGSKEMEIVDAITTVGLQTQRQAASELVLLRTRVGDTLTKEGASDRLTRDLVDLRLALKQINPHELSQTGLLQRLLYILPFRARTLRILERIAVHYEPVSQQVVIIETRLREGRMMLTRDNVDLRKLYEQVDSQQVPVQKNAYLGELLIQELQELMERTEDPRKKERIQNALYDASMRVQDLRTMEEVHVQAFVSIEMTRQNNTRVGQAVERTLTLATNVVMVGLAIQVALARQARVIEANRRTREFMGEMIVANAETIKRHTQEIGDVYKEPVIALEKIAQAHNSLIEAMDTADRLKAEGIAAARENITRLSQLAGELEERFAGMRELTEGKSLEA